MDEDIVDIGAGAALPLTHITSPVRTRPLSVVVDPSGRVSYVGVISGHPLLAPAALEAVQQWVYQPSGEAVSHVATVTINFAPVD